MSTTSFLSALGHPGTLPSLEIGEFTYPFPPAASRETLGRTVHPIEGRPGHARGEGRTGHVGTRTERGAPALHPEGRPHRVMDTPPGREAAGSVRGLQGQLRTQPGPALHLRGLDRAIHPDDRARILAAIEASIAGQTDYDIEYRITTPQGAIRWIQSRGQASYRPDGTPLAIAGISLDITDRKQVEEHRDLLAKELSHRVKNTLATIQSIVRQTLRRSTSLQEAEVALDARIQSLAAAHDVLTRDSWEGATLTEVVTVALRPFMDDQERRFEIVGPALRLGSRVALALAMALHELATNAVKYGALSNETGHVLLNWTMVDGVPPHRLRLRWQETGGPPVHPPTRTGFGSRMIERALATEIGGTAQIDYRPDGVVFTAEAPLPEVLGH